MVWEKLPRKVRLALPETCVFLGGNPEYWITKNKESAATRVVRSRSKMNMFEIEHFLLEGFLLHHPEVAHKRRGKDAFRDDARRQCIVAAKYSGNVTQLLTLAQIQNLFKSKHKYMRDGLMYLQTLVGAHHAQEVAVKIDLDLAEQDHRELYQRARREALIFVGETKVTDAEFYPERAEVEFERGLRGEPRRLLTYLSLKLVLISSKLRPTIMREAVFRWSTVGGCDFLWDLRLLREAPSAPFWENSVMQALEVKLTKTMSLMELQPGQEQERPAEPLSAKASEFSRWLDSSTENEWAEMGLIRSRLEKLETQKKALLESQKNGHGHEGNSANRSFRMRSLRKRESVMQPLNPEF